jgi:hypothetical protein
MCARLQGANYVVCTADSPVHKLGRWVNEACLELGLPHVSAGQFPPRLRIGPTFVPGQTACLACQEARMRRDFALYDELVADRQQARAGGGDPGTSLRADWLALGDGDHSLADRDTRAGHAQTRPCPRPPGLLDSLGGGRA